VINQEPWRVSTNFGLDSGDPDDSLVNVQCEVCHGPGEAHIANPSKRNIAGSVPESVCLKCHTSEHSEAFDYDTRIAIVRHDYYTQQNAPLPLEDPQLANEYKSKSP
jgi:hypothetical protein